MVFFVHKEEDSDLDACDKSWGGDEQRRNDNGALSAPA